MERENMLAMYLDLLNDYRAHGIVSEEEMETFKRCFIEVSHLPSAESIFEKAINLVAARKIG